MRISAQQLTEWTEKKSTNEVSVRSFIVIS